VAFAWKQKSMFLEARCKLALIVFLLYVSTVCSPIIAAQDPIRVETNQVLVPVLVLDKERFHRLLSDPENSFRVALPGNTTLVDAIGAVSAGNTALVDAIGAIAEGVVIHGLSSVDFHVFDDGKEQNILNVTYEQSLYRDVRDNRGHHTEYIGPGGGKWGTAEWQPGVIADLVFPQYVIAYALTDSPEGSCHKINIRINRDNALIAARSEYCNTKHSTADPLNGTTLGTQLETGLVSSQNNKIDISLLAIPLFTNSDDARVQIALDWPWKSLKGKSRARAVLGMVFRKDGSLLTRFSDLADMGGFADGDWPQGWPDWRVYRKVRYTPTNENRYETQLMLPPGEYDLRVVLGDGKSFGRAELPLTVSGYDKKGLAISGVALCKQISDVSVQNASVLPGAWKNKTLRNYVPLVSRDVEFEPTRNNQFKKGNTLYTYFEIYEPLFEGQSPAAVQFQMRIVDVKTGELRADSQPISATPYMKAGSSIIPVGRGLDISKLPIGSYRLEVQATDSTGKSTAWRTANFTVES
jgi:hypothetical protein